MVGGGCGVEYEIKMDRVKGLREGDDRYSLLKIHIAWPFVKFIGVFTSLINSMRVLN